MASPAFGNIVSSYGLKSNGSNAIDVIAGIPVRISNYQGTPTLYIYAGDKERASLTAAKMKDAAKSAGISAPKVSGDSVTFGFRKPMMAVSDYEKMREIVAANADSLTFDQCPYCFMGSCDVAGIYKSATARRMHRQCFLNHRNTEMDKINTSDGNYITGILGAVLAAIIVVAILDVIVIGAEKIYPFFYIMLPLFVAGGFRLGKGPYGPGGSFCHVMVSILAMFVYFYVIGCYYASVMYRVSMLEAVPYFGDVMSIVTNPAFLKESAMEMVFFFIGLVVAFVSNPTSKAQGRKTVSQNDVFITPLSAINTGFSGADTYHANYTQNASNGFATSYGTQDAYGNRNAYGNQNAYGTQDPYASQNTYGAQNSYGDQAAQNTGSDWREVYSQNSSNNNNNSGY